MPMNLTISPSINNTPVSKISVIFENCDSAVIPFSYITEFTLHNVIRNSEKPNTDPYGYDYYIVDDATFILNENFLYLPFNESYKLQEPIYFRISRNDIAAFLIEFQDNTKAYVYVDYKSESPALGARNIYQSSEIINGKLITTICKANAPYDTSSNVSSDTSPEGFYIYQLFEHKLYECEQDTIIKSYTSEEAALKEKRKMENKHYEMQEQYNKCFHCPYDSSDNVENNVEAIKNYCSKHNFYSYYDELCNDNFTSCENEIMHFPELTYYIKKVFVQS